MSLVAEYEAKIKEVVTAEIGTEEILNVFWEPNSGRLVFGYRETQISKTGRKRRKWMCFKLLVIDDDIANALKNRGISRDMWVAYLGTMIDNLGLNFEELLCPKPFAKYGVVDDRYVGEPFDACAWIDYMLYDSKYFMWFIDLAGNETFIAELAEKIKTLCTQ